MNALPKHHHLLYMNDTTQLRYSLMLQSQSDDATLSQLTLCYQACISLTDIIYTKRLKAYFNIHIDLVILYRSME
jgi:hypothetical protein